MKTLKNKITENRLREIINESVEDVLNRIGIINEMTVPLKVYKTRVDGLRFQLVENWCLCKWCQLFNPECENFAHWITELKACIDNLKFLDIKNGIDKRRTLTRMLVNDYDYNSANMIERIVRGKFVRENISSNNQKVRVCIEFADNINGLIDVISLDAIDSDEYIHSTFNYTYEELKTMCFKPIMQMSPSISGVFNSKIIGCSSPEFNLVDYPTMDDRLSDEVLKSIGSVKQEFNNEQTSLFKF